MLLASDQLLIRHLPSTDCRVVVAGQMQATFVLLIRHLPSTGCRVVVASLRFK
jgi:hypothetical protein